MKDNVSDINRKILLCLPIIILILASATIGILTFLNSHAQATKTTFLLSNSSTNTSLPCQPDQLNQTVAGFRQGVHVGSFTNSATGMIIHWQNISSQVCFLRGYPLAQFLSGTTVVPVDEMKGLFWLPFISPVDLPTVELEPHGGIASAAIFFLHYPHPIPEQGHVPWYNASCPTINTINLSIYPLSTTGKIVAPVSIKVPGLNSSNLGNNFTPCPRVVAVSNFQAGASANTDWPPPKFPTPTTTTTTTDPSTITNVAPVGTPYCNTNQLKFGWGQFLGGAHHFAGFLMIQNESNTSCALQGVPSFVFEDANGTPLPTQDQPQWDHNNALWKETTVPPDILMLPGGQDYAMVGWFFTQNPNVNTTCTNISLLKITLPTGSSSTFPSNQLETGGCLFQPPFYGQFTQIPLSNVVSP